MANLYGESGGRCSGALRHNSNESRYTRNSKRDRRQKNRRDRKERAGLKVKVG